MTCFYFLRFLFTHLFLEHFIRDEGQVTPRVFDIIFIVYDECEWLNNGSIKVSNWFLLTNWLVSYGFTAQTGTGAQTKTENHNYRFSNIWVFQKRCNYCIIITLTHYALVISLLLTQIVQFSMVEHVCLNPPMMDVSPNIIPICGI